MNNAFNSKTFWSLLSVALILWLIFFINPSHAKDQTSDTTAISKNILKQSNSQRLDELSIKLSNINNRLDIIDQKTKTNSSIKEVDSQLTELKKSISEESAKSFNTSSTLLNFCIGLTAAFITVVGVVFVVLAVLGFKDIKSIKQEISTELISKNLTDTQKIFTDESSKIREEFEKVMQENSTKVDHLSIQIRQIVNGEKPMATDVTANNPSPNENAFDDNSRT